MRGVDLQIDRLPVDAFVAPCYSGRLRIYLALHLREVVPSSAGDMMELSPFLLASDTCGSVGHMYFIISWLIISFAGEVDEL
jgi:hypothetical protein